jgi:histidinol dehydrogenase
MLRIFANEQEGRTALLKRVPSEQAELPDAVRQRLKMTLGAELAPGAAVSEIISRVRQGGDSAIRQLTRDLDGTEPRALEVTPDQIAAAYYRVEPKLVEALRFAAERIRAFHQMQLPRTWLQYEGTGAVGQIIRPLARVGVYSPRGSAGYPSTILMSAVPARVAGVDEVVLCAPPVDGALPSASTLVAADVAGVSRVFAIGGAQAIAAMAYGTESVPRVDKVLGPGNVFVALAKKQVSSDVAIDQIAGPTETLIVADEYASPGAVAADMLAQAEHDPMATALLITTSDDLAARVAAEIEGRLPGLSRGAVARESLRRTGGAIVVPSLADALRLANEYSPEHLCLLTRDPWSLVGLVRNAGGVFVGEQSLEAVGDYTAGPSHIMPTSGTARFSSPLSVWDFLKITSLFALSREQTLAIGPAAITIAEAEGFTAHADAIRHRLDTSTQ